MCYSSGNQAIDLLQPLRLIKLRLHTVVPDDLQEVNHKLNYLKHKGHLWHLEPLIHTVFNIINMHWVSYTILCVRKQQLGWETRNNQWACDHTGDRKPPVKVKETFLE